MAGTLLPALVASSSWFVAFPPVPVSVEPLPVAARTEWRLAPGQVRRHVVAMQDGDFLRVKVVQSGIDVTVRIHRPDGTSGHRRDLSIAQGGWEPASLLAAAPGDHEIEIAASPAARRPGRYVVETSPIHEPDVHERKRLAADALRDYVGEMMDTANTRVEFEDHLQGLLRIPLVAKLFHDIGDTCSEAEALTLLARVRSWRQDHAEVLELYPRVLDLWQACGDAYKQAEAVSTPARVIGARCTTPAPPSCTRKRSPSRAGRKPRTCV